MAKILAIQGGSANCGKTTLSVGICRALRNKGINVAPFKAVSVLSEKSFGLHNTVAHLCGAAQVPLTDYSNPIVVTKNSDYTADVDIYGRYYTQVKMMNSDTPIFDSLTLGQLQEVKKAIRSSLEYLNQEYDFILCEGASSPLDLMFYEAYDFSNLELVRVTNTPVVLVVRCIDGGNWPALIGTYTNYPEQFKDRIIGFIANEVLNPKGIFEYQLKQLNEKLSIDNLGVIPRVNYFDGVDESQPDVFEEEYKIWGRIAEEFIDVNRLIEKSAQLCFFDQVSEVYYG